jgi:hypothetical protein
LWTFSASPIYHPEAEKITLIHDNLNTHVLSALYETFEPQEAKPEQQFQIQNVVQETKVLKCLRSRGFVSICGISVMLYLVIDQVCLQVTDSPRG